MSTKLHHAIELDLTRPTLAAIQAWAEPVRQQMQAAADEVYASWVVQHATYLFDQATLAGTPLQQNWVALAYKEGREKIKATQEGRRDTEMDVAAAVQLIVDSKSRQIHGLVFIENPSLLELFYSQPEVLRAPYYDNDDTLPEGMTRQGWAARRRLWDRLLPDGIPCHAGVSLCLVDDRHLYGFPDATDISQHLPSLKKRVQRMRPKGVGEEIYLALKAGGEVPGTDRWKDFLSDMVNRTPFSEWVQDNLQSQLEMNLTPAQLLGQH